MLDHSAKPCETHLLSLMFSNNGFPGHAVVKNPANAGNARDVDLIPGSGRSPEVGNGNPLQYSCLENSMDRGAWWDALVPGVTKSQTRLSTIMATYVYLLDILAPQVLPDFYICTLKKKNQGGSSTANTLEIGKFAYPSNPYSPVFQTSLLCL